MKKRTGWISNSSSSSFIIIPDERFSVPELKESVLIVGQSGQTDFGWEFVEYHDFASKANFVLLQILYMREVDLFPDTYCVSAIDRILNISKDWKRCFDVLDSAIKKVYQNVNYKLYINHYNWTPDGGFYSTLGIGEIIYGSNLEGYSYGSIDHSSTVLENSGFKDIFKSEEKMFNYLFNNNSYLKTGNDNECEDD